MNIGMNNKNVDVAYEVLKNLIAIDGKINKAYIGQVDGFSSTILNGNLLSAIAFFSRKQNSDLNDNVKDDVNRQNVLKVIARILDQDSSVDFSINQDEDEIISLFNYVNTKDENKQNEILNQIIDAVVSIKFAIKLFPLISSNEMKNTSTIADEENGDKETVKDYAVQLLDHFNTETLWSNNMHYKYNIEYFKPIHSLEIVKDSSKEHYVNLSTELDDKIGSLKRTLNQSIINFDFKTNNSFAEIEDLSSFDLITEYPGLLVGIGYNHDLGIDGVYKCGFSFDYVTGNPYIPGSELKGLLRSYFPKDEDDIYKLSIINECLEKTDVNLGFEDISLLCNDIFENNDIFIGAYPVIDEEKENKLLDEEYITPHKDDFLNPNPISLIKVKPEIKFTFNFILHDFENEHIIISKKDKEHLFKNIILNFGVGAKTNVGFSYFHE